MTIFCSLGSTGSVRIVAQSVLGDVIGKREENHEAESGILKCLEAEAETGKEGQDLEKGGLVQERGRRDLDLETETDIP